MRLKDKGFTVRQILVAITILVTAGGIGWYAYQNRQDDTPKQNQVPITNFEQCKVAGYPIMESYPEQCAANGQTFVNEKQKVQN